MHVIFNDACGSVGRLSPALASKGRARPARVDRREGDLSVEDRKGRPVAGPSLFRQLLGPDMDRLPAPLRTVHDGAGALTLAGTAQIWRSTNPLARLLCDMMRLPAAGADVPVSITFDRHGDHERCQRCFAGRSYASRSVVRGGLLVERIGPATNIFRIAVSGERLRLDLVGFRMLGVTLPFFLRPSSAAVESADDGAFTFDVPVSLPGLGPVIRYTGRLALIGDA